jgi:hypothetical protein
MLGRGSISPLERFGVVKVCPNSTGHDSRVGMLSTSNLIHIVCISIRVR